MVTVSKTLDLRRPSLHNARAPSSKEAAVVGGVMGSLAGIVLVIDIVLYLLYRKMRHSSKQPSDYWFRSKIDQHGILSRTTFSTSSQTYYKHLGISSTEGIGPKWMTDPDLLNIRVQVAPKCALLSLDQINNLNLKNFLSSWSNKFWSCFVYDTYFEIP